MSGEGKLKFWCAATVAVMLLGGVGWFLSKSDADKKASEPKPRYTQSEVSFQRNASTASATTGIASKESESKVVDTLKITFRAVGLNRVSTEADQELAFNVLSEMKKSPYFDSWQTVGVGDVSPEDPLSEPLVKPGQGEPPGTFSFKIVAKLKRPLTL
jgi:hypothetical protein